MTTKRLTETMNIDKMWLDLSNWPTVLFDNLSPEEQELFLIRKNVIDLYIKNECLVKDIATNSGISRHEVRRLVIRCLQDDGSGKIWGYRGLIPQKRVSSYKRTKSIDEIRSVDEKYTGAFKLLLDNYPVIGDKIIDFYLHRRKDIIIDNRISVKYLHRHFINTCRSVGLNINNYPFTTKDMGRRSLYRYIKEIDCLYFPQSTKRNGDDAFRHALSTGIGEKNNAMIIRPFERVQFDGHRIDAILSITHTTIEGDEVTEELDRIWLLVIMDVATRAIIGHHLCLYREYSSGDVLHCIKNAIVPKKLRELKIPGLKYPVGYGFPSLAIPETQWALWEEFCYDNAKANLAGIVTDRLTHIVGCSTNAGPVNMPERRSLVERVFGTLEDNGYHRLPNTTGSNPDDPRRRNPEKKAKEFKISAEEFEELTEILIANYNLTYHEGINNKTPIECMQQRIEKGMFPRTMPSEQQNEVVFFMQKVQRKVVGDISTGRRPFINYEGVEYRNDVLSKSPNLIGTKLDLLVNIDDIRILRAYLPDGSEFGLLTATGKWGVRPHSLKTRKVINSLRNKNEFQITTFVDPIDVYQHYLESKSVKSKVPRNKLAELKRRKENDVNGNKNSDIKNPETINSKCNSIDDNEITNLNFKTINY